MAEANNEELERKATASQPRGVALADESPDELPALLAFAIGIAIITIALLWPSIRDQSTGSTETETVAAETVAAETEETVDDAEAAEEAEAAEGDETDGEAEVALPDIDRFSAELGIAGLALSADGNVVIAEGEVPDEATRETVIGYLQGQPNVESVEDRLTIAAAPAVDSQVSATAAQASIVLEGTVPDEATKAALVERAVAVYSEPQVEDLLVVDPAAEPPVTVNILGSMTDEVLFNQVLTAFDGVDGVAIGETPLTLEESSEVEASLNSLEPIQFASGSAVVEASSQAILDEAAAFLIADPSVAIEIGGHTDSLGGAEANETLSQDRAESVRAALVERGVTNEMTAVGFGERRLKVDPDENDSEAQATNRRIEFRILN